MVAGLAAPHAEIPLDLETLSAALGPLTMTEKQAAWFETMSYSPAQAGPMLRVSPETVEKVRHRAVELIRGKLDSWRCTLLAENGPALGGLGAVRLSFRPVVGGVALFARHPAAIGIREPAVSYAARRGGAQTHR